jgi:2-haloacid dehalogenase
MGVRKPTHAIYTRVMGMTQSDPRRTVFIDDREQNLAPARAMGVETLLFRGADELRKDLGKLGLV